MATVTSTMTQAGTGDIKATLNYYNGAPTIEPLDFTVPGTEQKFEEINKRVEAVPLTIHNIRGKEDKYTLEKNGFQYAKDEVKGLEGCTTEDEIKDVLLPATEALVKKLTGAYKTHTFTHRIRSLAEDPSKRADNKAPAHSVHTDFTPAGAFNQLATIFRDSAELAELKSGRVLVINVWRPLKPIKKDPLAVMNWESVSPKEEIIANKMILSPHFWAELGKVKYSEKHEWLYMEEQKPSEPMVFTQFDSKVDDGGKTVPHSAFVDDRWVGEEARQSIEIKMFAFLKE
ncbi:hypothetical protein K505DRAFT_353061 [Melanomma pulvis-pyrius CBS 109.77]|uniref:Methyltransferase n=1 Tax=Melanomma pulvis-pyrius CBS 109.77 TaxID=1314802 RepID=A0A6A6WY52_9PLEO|nr:hypothetical protein K505DRAFT_353061 [Melanomma pulvis-pyrius CBS 109.77]